MRKKPKYVYHGSPKLITGKFIPRSPKDIGKNKHNIICGIYACSVKNKAIGMAISGTKGVRGSGMGFGIGNQRKGIIYRGWPKQKYIYLYTFSSEKFKRQPNNSTQFVSIQELFPLKIEKLLVRDYIHLVRKATEKETSEWIKKYKP